MIFARFRDGMVAVFQSAGKLPVVQISLIIRTFNVSFGDALIIDSECHLVQQWISSIHAFKMFYCIFHYCWKCIAPYPFI